MAPDPEMAPVRVLIVDEGPLARESLRSRLATADGIEIAGEASDGAEAVMRIAEHGADVVLLGLGTSKLDALEAAKRIKSQRADTMVVLLAERNDGVSIADAVAVGASGYLPNDVPRDLLADTIRAAYYGGTLVLTGYLMEAIPRLVSTNGRRLPAAPEDGVCEKLTKRELEVLRLVAEGRTNKEVGRALFIAEDTAKKHVQSIIGKLNAAGQTHAVMKAARSGLIT